MTVKGVLVALYGTVFLTGVALCALLIMTPLLLKQMEVMNQEWEKDFDGVKSMSNEMWTDLLKMGADMRLPRDRLRRQYEEYKGGYENNQDTYNNIASNYQAQAPTYGYGYGKVKCCCAMKFIDYNGEHKNLPLSYKCPIGSRGYPGPPGEAGEDGQPGQPGYAGEDYPALFSPGSSGVPSRQTNYNSYGGEDPYGNLGYSAPAPSEKCEPCPRGLQGNPGTKGKPGLPGNKGEKGIQGIHGLPGVSGTQGQPGDVGVRGKSGLKGLPGPRGADGIGGNKGSPGSKGQMGGTGVPGPRGVSGPAGSPGLDGIRGRVGIRGIKGQRGLDGVDGVQGPPGIPGADAGYCKCPARVRDVQAGPYGQEPSTGYGRQSFSTDQQRSGSRSNASPPAATPQGDQGYNSDSRTGNSRQMEHRYGVVNEAIYNPLKTSETREYTTALHVNDLPANNVRREHHPPQQPYQPPRANTNYYNQQQRQDYSSDPQHQHVHSNNSPGPHSLAFQPQQQQQNDDLVIQDWNDDVRRRQRLLLAKRQRQRYFGRS